MTRSCFNEGLVGSILQESDTFCFKLDFSDFLEEDLLIPAEEMEDNDMLLDILSMIFKDFLDFFEVLDLALADISESSCKTVKYSRKKQFYYLGY